MPEITYRKLKDLKLLNRNPREINDRQFQTLCTSLQNNPDYFEARPLILSDRTGEHVIIAGNMRHRAAKKIGLKEVPTILLPGLTEEREREIVIRDNVSNGSWDWDVLSADWEVDELAEWGLDVPDFEAVDDESGDADAEPQIDKAAELNGKWNVKPGDLWQIGEHRLLCGDSTKREDVERLMQGDKADCVFTDPPYNALKSWKKDEARGETRLDPSTWFANDNMDWDVFEAFLASAFGFFNAHSAYVCCDYRIYPLVKALLEAAGYPVKHCIVWKKNVWGLGKRYRFQHEFIVYACKDDAPFFGDRSQSDVWEEAVDRETDHNTPKPIELAARAMSNSSQTGDVVVDYFGGGGSTMVAAQNAGRRARLMENAPRYCAVILQRMSDAFPDIEIKRIENGKA